MSRKKINLTASLARFVFIVSLCVLVAARISAQNVVDKTVATVGDGIGVPELITYSDLKWQLALIPNLSLNPPTSEDLNRALQLQINQRLFALEAERIPRGAPTQEKIDAKIKELLAQFPSTADFIKRLNTVGFDSITDENFQRIMAQRVSIDKYLDFRFRSFVVVTPNDEEKYYNDVYKPEFRRRNPGLLTPELDEKLRSQIKQTMTENRVAADIETFLDDAKSRAEIIILSEV